MYSDGTVLQINSYHQKRGTDLTAALMSSHDDAHPWLQPAQQQMEQISYNMCPYKAAQMDRYVTLKPHQTFITITQDRVRHTRGQIKTHSSLHSDNTTRNIQCSPFLVVIPEKGPQVIQVGRGVSNLSCILTGFLHKFTKINFLG
jgi:hypothetical protein